jgi:hypothetical protein
MRHSQRRVVLPRPLVRTRRLRTQFVAAVSKAAKIIECHLIVKPNRHGSSSRRLNGSYDAFFSGRSRISRVQFWGLLLLGLNLAALGIAVVAAVARKFAKPNINIGDGLILLPGVAVCAFVVYFGFLHLKRAFSGGNDKPSHRD